MQVTAGPRQSQLCRPHAQDTASRLRDKCHWMSIHLQILRHAFPHEARSYGLQRALHIAVVAVHDDQIYVACGQVQTCSKQEAGRSDSRDPQHAALPPVKVPKHVSLAPLETIAPKDVLGRCTASDKPHADLLQLVDLSHASTEELGKQQQAHQPAHL